MAVEKTLPAVFVPASGSGLGRDIVKEELLDRVEQVALVAADRRVAGRLSRNF
ncbi:hypothetical protein P6F33_gp18 [Pseudomonas phage Quinobequin-P09]|uniref:Uncharacterized protein n=1 Tax=Pseudomonas phage Quinobequin-P09 TaxID=2660687 RepID=A0A5P8PQS4_9CAUD|nr:hypothetical protein P6F33_gp18 [Pseudomonas phage Quinobequin-P09]QFR59619.1 hypothetical protein QuinobequinP09_66 [Pseudomonas phage Quinobequin-P09]